MTANHVAPSPGEEAFNVSLKEAAGKSTLPTLNSVQKVVIDAGHGGKDPGGMGQNSKEKQIVLKIAQLLAIGIRTNYPDVEVIMTRSDDTFIPLYERAAIANREGADLFISIHANIMPGSSATAGTETFVMGQHVARHNLEVAKRENASILLEDNVQENYGYDPNSDEGHIMMSMFQHAFLERSILFAELVENEFADAGRKSRGVKQAGFVVLKETTMPSVLIETGFMSNGEEEAFLLSSAGQQKLANSILKAFNNYYSLLGGKAPVVAANAPASLSVAPARTSPSPQPTPVAAPPPALRTVTVYDREVKVATTPAPTAISTTRTTAPVARNPQWTAKGVDPKPITYYPTPAPASSPNPLPATYGTPMPAPMAPALPQRSEASKNYESLLSREISSNLRSQPTLYQRSSQAAIAQPTVPTDTVPGKKYNFGDAGARKPVVPPGTIDLSTIGDDKLTYAVQMIATKKDLDLTQPNWQRIPYPVLKIKEDEWNKYQVRGLKDAAMATEARTRIQATGFTDAMIVVYYQNKRLGPAHVGYLLSR